MPLLFASVAVGTVIPSRGSTRPCKPSFAVFAAAVSSGSALTAASAAAFVSSALAFNALRLASSSGLMMPSLLALSNASFAALSAASAASTFAVASAILLVFTTTSSPGLPASLTAFATTSEPPFTLSAEIVALPVVGLTVTSGLDDVQLPSEPLVTVAVFGLPASSV